MSLSTKFAAAFREGPQLLERTSTVLTEMQPLPGEPEAIFVVGVARSGTTLMRFLLETSPRIGIARENHYVGHVLERQGARFYFPWP